MKKVGDIEKVEEAEVKEAPKKLPQNKSGENKEVPRKLSQGKDEKSKEAPRKLPKKQGWMLFFSTVALLAWTAVSTIASQLIIGYIMIAILGADRLEEPAIVATYSAISYLLTFILVFFVPPRVMKLLKYKMAPTSRTEIGLKDWPTWTDIMLSPIAYIVYLIIAAGIVALFNSFDWFDAGQAQDVGYSVMMSSGERVIAFVMLVVAAPVTEEIIFRGWLYGKLREKFSVFKSKWLGMGLAIFLVSVLFGALHMQWNVGVNVFALSIVLCVLREITGTIYAGILLHMLKNGIAFYLLYVAGV